MKTFISSIPALVLLGGILLFDHYPPDQVLRPWTSVGSNAYLEAVNNSTIDLPIVVRAPAVDSAVRYLGLVPKCSDARFKLPYADTRIILTIGSVSDSIDIEGPGTWSVTIFDEKNPCPQIAKIAVNVAEFVDPGNWRSSPWYRPGDVETPVKLVLAGDGTVCAVYEIKVEPIRVGDVYVCKTGWIIPH